MSVAWERCGGRWRQSRNSPQPGGVTGAARIVRLIHYRHSAHPFSEERGAARRGSRGRGRWPPSQTTGPVGERRARRSRLGSGGRG